jgi:hypothetical protein
VNLTVLYHDKVVQVGHQTTLGILLLLAASVRLLRNSRSFTRLLGSIFVGFAGTRSVTLILVAYHLSPANVNIFLLDSVLLLDYYGLCDMVRVVIGALAVLLKR